jgi:hypothetical protein
MSSTIASLPLLTGSGGLCKLSFHQSGQNATKRMLIEGELLTEKKRTALEGFFFLLLLEHRKNKKANNIVQKISWNA